MFDKQTPNVLFFSLAILLSGMPFVVMALEDPTRPPDFVSSSNGTSSAQVPTWQVSSILISKDRRLAVVNGKTVKQGEKVGGARVVSISSTAVRLRNSIETFTVKLLPAQVKSVQRITKNRAE